MKYPVTRPPVTEVHGEGDKRCVWGRCEVGGWILARAIAGGAVVTDDKGGLFHPGCLAAMRYANRPQRAESDGPELCRAGTEPNRCAYGDCKDKCLYVLNGRPRMGTDG